MSDTKVWGIYFSEPGRGDHGETSCLFTTLSKVLADEYVELKNAQLCESWAKRRRDAHRHQLRQAEEHNILFERGMRSQRMAIPVLEELTREQWEAARFKDRYYVDEIELEDAIVRQLVEQMKASA